MRMLSARPTARGGAVVLAAAAAAAGAAWLAGGGAAVEGDSHVVVQRAGAAAGSRAKAHVSFYRARDVKELISVAGTAVVARVTSVADGPAWVSDDPRARGLTTDLPTREVRLVVESRLRGEIEAQPVWTLPLAPGGFEVEHAETPRAGERYLLFLTRHPAMPGRWIVPAIDGRVRLGADGSARSALGDGVGRSLARRFNAAGAAAVWKEIR
jgi:hypothetical protein